MSLSHDKLLLGSAWQAIQALRELYVLGKETPGNLRWKDGMLTEAVRVESSLSSSKKTCMRKQMEEERVNCLPPHIPVRKMEKDFDLEIEDKFVLLRYTADELQILVKTLEGGLDADKLWTSRDLGLVSDNNCNAYASNLVEDGEVLKTEPDQVRESFSRSSRVGEMVNINAPCSHGLFSSEVLPSECQPKLKSPHVTVDTHNKVLNDGVVVERRTNSEQDTCIDLNLDLMSDYPARKSSCDSDNSNNNSVTDVETFSREKICGFDEVSEPVLKRLESDCSSSVSREYFNKYQHSISMGHQDSDGFEGNKLFGIELQFPHINAGQSNTLLKAATVNSSDVIASGQCHPLSNPSVEPIKFGSVIFGKLLCSSQAIFPKGFTSRVEYFNVLNPTEISSYISEVLNIGLLGPLFKQLNQEILKRRNLGESGLLPLQLPQSINGLEMFGFFSPPIVQAIEALDPNHQCLEYWNKTTRVNNEVKKYSIRLSCSVSDSKAKHFGVYLRKQDQDDPSQHSVDEEVEVVLRDFSRRQVPNS
ncbi:putative Fasciclin-like arabinogalactan family protein [Hibiscus syriacus]|uniref:Fasciclin-like arabinogalactan family protein n=1 Tax=Hibiscus syriacus TaxID=106335 RepID=A0A6A2YUT2_HIBSY|nr:putative Fasciclin-like arabinogalactan family protein [Hibiscus syriacus]